MGNRQEVPSDTKRCLVTGCDYAGKTCIIDTILRNAKKFPPRPEGTLNQKASHGLNIQFTVRNKIKLALYDMPGLKRHRHLLPSYYDHTDLIVFVVSMTNPKRLMEARAMLRDMVHNTTLHGVPVLVYCNKHDRKIRTNHDHIRKVLQLDDIKDRHWHIQECSALTGYGLEVGLEWACNELLKGLLANRLRRIVTAPVTYRHRQMMKQMIEEHETLLKLKNIQVKFEYISGILYGLSSIMSALDELDLPWERTYSSSSEVVAERRRSRRESLNMAPEQTHSSIQFLGESKVENEREDDERAPLLRSQAEQKTQSHSDTAVLEKENSAPRDAMVLGTGTIADISDVATNLSTTSAKDRGSEKKKPSDSVPQLERTAAPETNEESAPLLSS